MMKATRQFYNLPLEEKKRHSNLVNGKEFRLQGYGGDMMVAEDQVLHVKLFHGTWHGSV